MISPPRKGAPSFHRCGALRITVTVYLLPNLFYRPSSVQFVRMLINLINNIAFLVALVAAGLIVLKRFRNDTLHRQVLLGFLFGGVALLGMLNPVNFAPGIIFDGPCTLR
eukprot:TRINITY_DN647_c0_g2_i1.p1 TRINITY_DN647_c0_g2~~TRINITY_DN647_c0_g2_i1.p1  ORF type:complete len:110 (+),score=2.01 TRINITY_DN647_c0_g2_i1:581-910(+)